MSLVELELLLGLELSVIDCAFDISYVFDYKVGRAGLVDDLWMDSWIIEGILFLLGLGCFGLDLVFHHAVFISDASDVVDLVHYLGILFVSNFFVILVIFVFWLTFRKDQLFALLDDHLDSWFWFVIFLFFDIGIGPALLDFRKDFLLKLDVLIQ